MTNTKDENSYQVGEGKYVIEDLFRPMAPSSTRGRRDLGAGPLPPPPGISGPAPELIFVASGYFSPPPTAALYRLSRILPLAGLRRPHLLRHPPHSSGGVEGCPLAEVVNLQAYTGDMYSLSCPVRRSCGKRPLGVEGTDYSDESVPGSSSKLSALHQSCSVGPLQVAVHDANPL